MILILYNNTNVPDCLMCVPTEHNDAAEKIDGLSRASEPYLKVTILLFISFREK